MQMGDPQLQRLHGPDSEFELMESIYKIQQKLQPVQT